MYSIQEIILVIIGFIILFVYFKITTNSQECDAEENFGNFGSITKLPPVIEFINKKYNETTNLDEKKLLFIPTIFNNNVFYKDSDFKSVSMMNFNDLSSYVKTTNTQYFIDLLNIFTSDICSPNEYKILLNLFANGYIRFNNTDQEDLNNTLENHFSLYLEVKKSYKSYLNILSNKIRSMDEINHINSTLSDVIEQLPKINTGINKLKSLKLDQDKTYTNPVETNATNFYKNMLCAKKIKLGDVKQTDSKFLYQIQIIKNNNKYNQGNITLWIPSFVSVELTDEDIKKSNNMKTIDDVFVSIIFPKIFNYTLLVIDSLENLKTQIKDKTVITAIKYYLEYITSYLVFYILIKTKQGDATDLIKIQNLESIMEQIYSLIIKSLI